MSTKVNPIVTHGIFRFKIYADPELEILSFMNILKKLCILLIRILKKHSPLPLTHFNANRAKELVLPIPGGAEI